VESEGYALLVGRCDLPLELDLLDAVVQFLDGLEPLPALRESNGEPGVYYEPTGWIVLERNVAMLRRLTLAVRFAEERRWKQREQELERRLRETRSSEQSARRHARMYERMLRRIRDGDYSEPEETPVTLAAAAVPYGR
jgi:hypothetical protein